MATDILYAIKARIADGLCDLRVVGEQFTGKWDQDAPMALLDELSTLRTRLAEAEAREKRMREALDDLLSWFPDEPSKPEWRLVAGEHGADDAISFARAVLEDGGSR